MVVISFTSLSALYDDGRTDPIAVWERCNKVAGSVVLPIGDMHAGSLIDVTQAGVRDRTKEAFQELVLAELPVLYSLARRLVRDGSEDLVQEALLQAFKAFATLKEDAAAGRWLKTILINVFRDQLRKRSRTVDERPMGDLDEFSLYRTLVDEDPFPYSDTLHADFLQGFDSEDLREVIIRLPDIYRIPLVLRYMYGFATKEIARLADAPLGTILARLHRGRRLFEREMWTYAQEAGLLTKES